MNKFVLSFILSLSSPAAFAQSKDPQTEAQASVFDILPARGGLLSNVVIDSQVNTARVSSYTNVKLHVSCYATNLRSVANPVVHNSMIYALIDAYDSSGTVQTITVKFPADYLKPNMIPRTATDGTNLAQVSVMGYPNTKWSAYDNTIQVFIPGLKSMTITSSGEVTNLTEKNLIVTGIRFIQRDSPSAYYGSYFGSAGPLSSSITWYTSKDGKSIDVYASFPGAASPGMRAQYEGETRTGFCGAFYSPIMLFFGESLPEFTGRSSFAVSKGQAGKIYWPEADAAGYFLVLDEKGDSKIVDGTQMFGDTEKFTDGFANLASHDLNKDRVIDKKDKVFKKLKLWNDKNSDGVSQKTEVFPLQELGVTSIDLKFTNETLQFGERAQYKQKSSFQFKRDGKTKTGAVLDIWFSPAGN